MRRGLLASAAATAVAFALVGPVCFRPIWDTDAGWHLALGRLIRTSGIPHTNVLAWTAPDEPWYPTTWLFDWTTAALEGHLGLLGLQLFGAFLLLLALAALAAALRLADPQGPWLLPAGALMLLPRITLRPHLATWAALALVLAACLRGRGKGTRYRIFCISIIALFGNLHAGAGFAAGVAGLFCLEEFARTRRPAELITSALCGLALAANPGVLDNLRYLVANLSVQSMVQIQEFLPASPGREPLFFAVMPLALLAGFWRRRQAGLALGASFAALALFGLRSGRVAYDALVVALPLLALGLGAVRERFSARVAALLAVLCAAGSAAATGYSNVLATARIQPAWNAERLPVRAADFARQLGLQGRRFNALRDGGYLEWVLPEQQSFLDGRIQAFPPSFWRAFQEAERTPASFRDWVRGLGVEWAIATRMPERLGGFRLFDGPDWALIYWDTASEIWLRRDVARFAPFIERYEYHLFRPYGSIVGAVGVTPRAALPSFAREVGRYDLNSPGDPYSLLVKCALAARAASPSRDSLCDLAATSDEPVRSLSIKARSLAPATQ